LSFSSLFAKWSTTFPEAYARTLHVESILPEGYQLAKQTIWLQASTRASANQ